MEFARPNRRIGAGKHPLTKVFPGLDADPGFVGLFPDGARREVLAKCYIEAVPEDMYMYIDDSDGHVVAGLEYIKTGEPWVVYLDVIHELTHIRQWRAGKPLWDRRYSYVDRPTEVEAYQVAVDRAKELGIPEREICDYLRVEWVSRQEQRALSSRRATQHCLRWTGQALPVLLSGAYETFQFLEHVHSPNHGPAVSALDGISKIGQIRSRCAIRAFDGREHHSALLNLRL